MESPLINHILTSVHKASKFLYRDFFELEMQQSSRNINPDFLEKSYKKCGEKLSVELAKFGDQYSYSIKPIDSLLNLSRAMPYFGITVIAFDKNDPEVPLVGVIDFPLLQESYYAENAKGAWLRRHNSAMSGGSIRLGVSKRQNELTLACDEMPANYSNVKHIRNFGSDSYSLCLFAAGKVDALYLVNPSNNVSIISKLFCQESRGQIISDKPLILSNGCSNID